MSVTFSPTGHKHSCENPFECPVCSVLHLNVSNANARALLQWLDLEYGDLWGEINASELAAKCRRRLWPEERNIDPGVPAVEEGRVIDCGRRPGYLPERTAQLLKLAEEAQKMGVTVSWG
jgi:hypothetical protein